MAKHYGLCCLLSTPQLEFAAAKAICSYEELHGGDASCVSKRFQAVAMHSLPTRVKPFHVLSQGEQERFLVATTLKEGARGSIHDDRFAMVDSETAQSMSTALHRYLCQHDCGRMLLATCNTSVLPFLQPDVVIELMPDKAVVHRNPNCTPSLTLMRPQVSIDSQVEFFASGKGGGWRGPEDSLDTMLLQPCRGKKINDAAVAKEYSVEVSLDKFTQEVSKAFDFTFHGTITQKVFILKCEALSFKWSIGAIIGPSGSGKTTNLKHFGEGLSLEWSTSASVWDQLPFVGDKKKLLEAVTLPEAVAARCFHQLSAGERSLAELARSLCGNANVIAVDEFTSLLDRHRAYEVCKNLHLFVLERGIQLVVAGCHKDIIDWLRPTWVFAAESGELIQRNDFTLGLPPPRAEVSFEVPKIELTMRRISTNRESADIFRRHFATHHYMEGRLPFNIYGLLVRTANGELVGYHGVSQQPGAIHDAMRETRLVVLPRFQGHGIGPKISTMVGALMKTSGMRFFSKTSQEALGMHRIKANHLWRPTTTNLKISKGSLGEGFSKKRMKREAAKKKEAEGEGDLAGGASSAGPSELCDFDTDCKACARERAEHKLCGRPPKHTCGRPPARPTSPRRPAEKQLVERLCYSHEYVGPARPQKHPRSDVDEEMQATKLLKMMTVTETKLGLPESVEVRCVLTPHGECVIANHQALCL